MAIKIGLPNGVFSQIGGAASAVSRRQAVAAAVSLLRARSCLIDGEAVVCDDNGLAIFDLIRGYRNDAAAVLCAFDLIELDGEDLRRTPVEQRKAALATLLRDRHDGILFNEHHSGEGAVVFKHVCALGCVTKL
jgi:bifunctional non-homologous end joining protein LigD